MTSRFYIGSENQGEQGLHDYFVEIFERPAAALYVHATQIARPDGSTSVAIHYCPLKEASGQPFFAQAQSIFKASRTRI